jgi:hypothetical protein
MEEVDRVMLPNVELRKAGLHKTRGNEGGKLAVDFEGSEAFAMVDHQVAHVYAAPRRVGQVREMFEQSGEYRVYDRKSEGAREMGLMNNRAGDLLLVTPGGWMAHDWWLTEAEKPQWQFTVDIHNKPGYDPRELFFDPAKKCIAQNPRLVKGSHGASRVRPVILSDAELPVEPGEGLSARQVAPWLKSLLCA